MHFSGVRLRHPKEFALAVTRGKMQKRNVAPQNTQQVVPKAKVADAYRSTVDITPFEQ